MRLPLPKIIIAMLALAFVLPPAHGQTPKLFIIEFEPGLEWDESVRYEHQPNIEAHLAYWQSLYLKEVLLMSGPFADQSGGLFLVRAKNLSLVEDLVLHDPGVKSGVITAKVRLWRILTSAMRSSKPQIIEVEPDRSFKIQRLDPDSSLNLPQN